MYPGTLKQCHEKTSRDVSDVGSSVMQMSQ